MRGPLWFRDIIYGYNQSSRTLLILLLSGWMLLHWTKTETISGYSKFVPKRLKMTTGLFHLLSKQRAHEMSILKSNIQSGNIIILNIKSLVYKYTFSINLFEIESVKVGKRFWYKQRNYIKFGQTIEWYCQNQKANSVDEIWLNVTVEVRISFCRTKKRSRPFSQLEI